MKRPDFMALAIAEAEAAGAARRSADRRGASSSGGAVIARAGNRTRELSDPTAHAEMLVIREAGQTLSAERLLECRPLCDAGTLRHVRRRHLLRQAAPALFRR